MFPQVYAVGQPLLLGIRLQTENNVTPTYCTITDDSTNLSINNLEMLIGRNNLVKNRKCSIDKDVLIDSILDNSETSIN